MSAGRVGIIGLGDMGQRHAMLLCILTAVASALCSTLVGLGWL